MAMITLVYKTKKNQVIIIKKIAICEFLILLDIF